MNLPYAYWDYRCNKARVSKVTLNLRPSFYFKSCGVTKTVSLCPAHFFSGIGEFSFKTELLVWSTCWHLIQKPSVLPLECWDYRQVMSHPALDPLNLILFKQLANAKVVLYICRLLFWAIDLWLIRVFTWVLSLQVWMCQELGNISIWRWTGKLGASPRMTEPC